MQAYKPFLTALLLSVNSLLGNTISNDSITLPKNQWFSTLELSSSNVTNSIINGKLDKISGFNYSVEASTSINYRMNAHTAIGLFLNYQKFHKPPYAGLHLGTSLRFYFDSKQLVNYYIQASYLIGTNQLSSNFGHFRIGFQAPIFSSYPFQYYFTPYLHYSPLQSRSAPTLLHQFSLGLGVGIIY